MPEPKNVERKANVQRQSEEQECAKKTKVIRQGGWQD